MSLKPKFKAKLLQLFSLGTYQLMRQKHLQRLAQQRQQVKNFDVEALIASLGGAYNVSGVEYRRKKLRIFIHNRNEIDQPALSANLALSKLFVGNKSVSFVLPHRTKMLAEHLITVLSTIKPS